MKNDITKSVFVFNRVVFNCHLKFGNHFEFACSKSLRKIFSLSFERNEINFCYRYVAMILDFFVKRMYLSLKKMLYFFSPKSLRAQMKRRKYVLAI
jgi:hypothetical protein